MKKMHLVVSGLILVSLLLTACGGGQAAPKDLLNQIQTRGTLAVSTDPNYAGFGTTINQLRLTITV